MGAIRYALLYLLSLNLALPALVPAAWVYQGRMEYELAKDNPAYIDTVIDEIETRIRRERVDDFVILLGDSVTYSGPGGPEQSLAPAIEAVGRAGGRPLSVFNLAMPAMQAGDIYVVLLKLRERGIPLRRVAINLIYGGFVAREPDPPAVFWLARELRRLDPEAYHRVREHLAANRRDVPPPGPVDWFRENVTERIALIRYRDVIRRHLLDALPLGGRREVYDTRRWDEKPGLKQLLQAAEYRRLFDPAPFSMDESNPQVYFVDRIIRAVPDARLLFWIGPVNQELMADEVGHPGYRANLARVDQWFAGRPVRYVNLERELPAALFADHLHLTPEGYRSLASRLYRELSALP